MQPRRPFWERVTKSSDPNGCWLYTGTLSWGGYGLSRWQGRTTQAHRRAYMELVGPIPEGLHLDHLCGVRNCVNPAHLEPVTRLENNRRSGNGNSRKMYCIRGHPLFGPNVYIRPNRGNRECITCKRMLIKADRAAGKRRPRKAA